VVVRVKTNVSEKVRYDSGISDRGYEGKSRGTPPVLASTPQPVVTSLRTTRLGELTSATVPTRPRTAAMTAEIAESSRLIA